MANKLLMVKLGSSWKSGWVNKNLAHITKVLP